MNGDLFRAGLALLLVPSTVAMVLHRLPDPTSGVRAFRKPTHRVAVATEEAMRAELGSVVFGNSEMVCVPSVGAAAGQVQRPLREDSPTFWHALPVQGGPAGQALVILQSMQFHGKARDGRQVHVTVKGDPLGEGSVVDCHGDEAAARALSTRIADRLAHPIHQHDSPEDRAALLAFFGPRPSAGPVAASRVDPAVRRAGGPPDAVEPSVEDR